MFLRSVMFAILLSPLLFSGCDNSVELFSPFSERPIVYSLLDPTDSVHYFRIQRNFGAEGIDALTLAQDPDLLYFPEGRLEVFVDELQNEQVLRSWELERVDGDTIGLIREEGTFAASPNILYRFKAQLEEGLRYDFRMLKGDTLISSTTTLVNPFQVFFITLPGASIDLSDTNKLTIEIGTADNGYLYDCWYELFFMEEELASGTSSMEMVRFPVFRNVVRTPESGPGVVDVNFANLGFYTGLRSVLEPKPGFRRHFQKLEMTVNAGGVELYLQYLNVIANTGLIQDFSTTQWSNINGGLGILSSRREVRLDNILLTPTTIDSLACGRLTGHLGFAPSEFYPTYPLCN